MENIWDGERPRHEQNEWAQGGTWYTSKWRLERRKLPHPTDSCSLGPLPVQRTDIRTRTQTEGLALPLRLCLATSWLCVFSLSVKWGKGSPCIIPLKFPVIFQEYSGFDPGLSCHHFSGLG